METFTVEAIVLDTKNFDGNVTLHPAVALKLLKILGKSPRLKLNVMGDRNWRLLPLKRLF